MKKILVFFMSLVVVSVSLLLLYTFLDDKIESVAYDLYENLTEDEDESEDLYANVEVTPTATPTATPTDTPTEEQDVNQDDEIYTQEETYTIEEQAIISFEEDSTYIFTDEFTELDYELKLEILQLAFPEGMYWNTCGIDTSDMTDEELLLCVTETACIHNYYGTVYCHEYDGETLYSFNFSYNIQCLAFASLISDLLYGADSEVIEITDKTDLQIGDHIRLTAWDHSLIITDIDEETNSITVAEVNQDYETCEISWDRTISLDWLAIQSFRILRRV